MTDQGTGVDPEKAIANITKGPDKKEDLMLIMTAHSKWDRLFVPAPLSISLLGELLLVCADRDISLKDRCPEGGFKYLIYPDSFRACLVQITNSGWNAFNNAHTKMDQIRLHTANVETHIKYAVRILLGGTAKEIEKTLALSLSKVSEIADTCKTLASETEQKFIDAMLLTEEALEACVAAKGHYNERDKETEIAIRVAKEQKMLSEESKKQLDEHYQKKEKELNIVKQEFDSAVTKMPCTIEIAGAYMIQGIFDTFKSVISTVSTHTEPKEFPVRMCGDGDGKQPKQTPMFPGGNLNRVISIIKGMQKLFEGLRPNMNAVAKGSALEVQQRLAKENNRLDDDSLDLHPDLGDCINEATEVCSDLIKYTSLAAHDDEQAGKIKISHDKLQSKLQKIEARMNRKRVYPIESTPLTPKIRSNSSLSELISVKSLFKVEMAKEHLADAKRECDKTYKESRKESERLMQTLVDLQRLDLTKIGFDEIQNILIKGISALAEVRKQWGKLCEFFQMISNLIKCCLHSSLKCFADYSSEGSDLILEGERMSNIFKRCIIEQATEANRVAYVAQNISSAYVEISSKYLMDGITSLGKLLPLNTKENLAEMTHKRAQLREEMENAQRAISGIMEKNKREFDERISERVKRIETEVEAILPTIPEERVKEIRSSVQDAFITDSTELEEAIEDLF